MLLVALTFEQQEGTYDNKIFKTSEVLKATFRNSVETISFFISEHDMKPNGSWTKGVRRLKGLGKIADPNDASNGEMLSLSVYFKK